MSDLDPSKFRLPDRHSAPGMVAKTKFRRSLTHGPRQKFLKGPIPWLWLQRAARLPGKALHVAIELWHLSGLLKSDEVRPSLSKLGGLGVSRTAAARGLAALESAGLVSVERGRGRKALVTIESVQEEDQPGGPGAPRNR